MPLFDHFRPPLFHRRHWESFHTRWAVAVADELNATLPPRFLAETTTHIGSVAEAEVVEWDAAIHGDTGNGVAGGTAVATYAPPATSIVVANQFPPAFAVDIRDSDRGLRLAAVVEFVSPGNKDRADARSAFAGKMAGYLQAAAGLVVVDVVTDKFVNLHNEYARLAGHPPDSFMADDIYTYAAAYRPVVRGEQHLIDIWPHPLAVGDALPKLPLALRGYGCVPLDLEATYAEACRRCRIS